MLYSALMLLIRTSKPQFTLELGLLDITSESIHTLTTCSLNELLNCWQCFMFPLPVESTSQPGPAGIWRVVDEVVNDWLPVVWPLLSYLLTFTLWHQQNFLTQFILFNWCSSHGDIFMSQAGVWGIRRQRTSIMCTLCTHHNHHHNSELSQPGHILHTNYVANVTTHHHAHQNCQNEVVNWYAC